MSVWLAPKNRSRVDPFLNDTAWVLHVGTTTSSSKSRAGSVEVRSFPLFQTVERPINHVCTSLADPSPSKGFAWGRHRQVRTPPSTLTLQGPIGSAGSSRELEEKLDPLRDDDVDCDMLANAGNDGYSIERVGRDERGWRTRRRAVWEKGIRAVRFFRGRVCLSCQSSHGPGMLTTLVSVGRASMEVGSGELADGR